MIHFSMMNDWFHCNCTVNKKAELSQRWPRDAPCIWVPWKFSGVTEYAHGYFSRNFNRLSSDGCYGYAYKKFLALPVPEIIGNKQQICAVPGHAHARFSPKCLLAFVRWIKWMFWLNLKSIDHSFNHSWDNSHLSFWWGCEPSILGKRRP